MESIFHTHKPPKISTFLMQFWPKNDFIKRIFGLKKFSWTKKIKGHLSFKLSKVVCQNRVFFTESHLPSKVIFYQRLSSIIGFLPSKVIFNQSTYSTLLWTRLDLSLTLTYLTPSRVALSFVESNVKLGLGFDKLSLWVFNDYPVCLNSSYLS